MDCINIATNGYDCGFSPLEHFNNAEELTTYVLSHIEHKPNNRTLRLKLKTDLYGFLKEQVFKTEAGIFDKLDIKNFLFPYFHHRKEKADEKETEAFLANLQEDADMQEIVEKVQHLSHDDRMRLSLFILQSLEEKK